MIKKEYGTIDILINNAAQTVRRPPVYYIDFLECEKKPLPKPLQDIAKKVIVTTKTESTKAIASNKDTKDNKDSVVPVQHASLSTQLVDR
eukprot:UN14225